MNKLFNQEISMNNTLKIFIVTIAVFSMFAFTSCNKEEEQPPVDSETDEYLLLFNALKGKKVHTGGWADFANNGQGIGYTNPAKPIIICDERYPDSIEKRFAFTDALNSDEETFIILNGDIDLSDGRIIGTAESIEHDIEQGRIDVNTRRFDIGSNTTLIGLNNARIMFGGLRVEGTTAVPRENVIIRNITFSDAIDTRPNPGLDQLLVRRAVGVWVNHNKFTHGDRWDPMSAAYYQANGGEGWHDDTLNMREGQVTASWNEFTRANRTMLIGSGDGDTNREARRVTLHHNYYHNVRQRVPRTRGTLLHLYNNYFTNIGLYVFGPGVNAAFVAQNNLFDSNGLRGIVDTSFTNTGAVVWSEGNAAMSGISGVTNGVITTSLNGTKPWEPGDFYDFTLSEDVDGLRELIPGRAGPTLVTVADFLE